MSGKKRGNPVSKSSLAQPYVYKRTRHGPEPERFKIEGYANWQDAVKVALRKPKPLGGWPKK
jgi:hypothetical protein